MSKLRNIAGLSALLLTAGLSSPSFAQQTTWDQVTVRTDPCAEYHGCVENLPWPAQARISQQWAPADRAGSDTAAVAGPAGRLGEMPASETSRAVVR